MDTDPRRHGTTTDRSGADLVKDLVSGTQALIREEIELAKLELKANVTAKAVGIGLLVGVAVLSLYLIGFLAVAAGTGLAHVMPDWAAWLVVAGVFLLIIVVMVLVARGKLRGPAAPEMSIERMKGDAEWAKQTFKRS